ncbi:MAG: hypothetical protein H7Y03_05245 [Chitinophagaceae bacterium]|nr:hypothetical protein [Chitinophagaceae bacterium]
MKKIFVLLILCFTASGVFSQAFMHGAGVGVFVDKARYSDAKAYGTLIYSPRVNFVETETMALSVGIPITIGFSGSYTSNSYSGDSGDFGFLFNAPVVVNINMGRGSTKDNESKFGYFAGAGFGYHYGARTFIDEYYDYNESSTFSAYGPAANAGVRIGVGRSHKNIEILLSYMRGIDDSKANIYGLSTLFNF